MVDMSIKQIIYKNIYILFLVFFISLNLHASKDSDFGSWNTLVVTKDLNKQFSLINEVHLRFSHDITRLSQSLIRPSVNYKINNSHSLAAGYTWVYSSTALAPKNTNEHNIWEQYKYIFNFRDLDLTSRSRLEQRFIQRVSKTNWRYRHFVEVKRSLNNKIIDFLSISDEMFFLLNDTARGIDNRGYSENRLYIGLGKNVDKQSTLQLGYQHQNIRRFGQNNFNANMIVFMLNTHFS